jgi:hypothetical protein
MECWGSDPDRTGKVMKCKRVCRLLSPYLDGMLESGVMHSVRKHVDACDRCRGELRRLESLHQLLSTAEPVAAPDYLHHLLSLRLSLSRRDTWSFWFKEALEYQWSRIRTREMNWYLIRILGTAATFVFFLFITAATRPIYFDLQTPPAGRNAISQDYTYQVRVSLLRNLGYAPIDTQRIAASRREPRMNDFMLVNFGENASRSTSEDSFSVVTVVDRNGTAKISNVIEYPEDEALLDEFNAMLQSAQCRPASQNGRAVDSRLVMTFSKISVYD